jgi:hypothetical protein
MKIRNHADMLAYIPYAINREPKNMVVLSLKIKDEEHGNAAILAFRLPEGPDPDFIKAMYEGVREIEAESCIAVIYTDDEGCEDGHPPHMDIATVILVTFQIMISDVPLLSMLTVGKDGWWNLDDVETKHSLDEITDSTLNAEMIADGRTYRRGDIVIPEPTAASASLFLGIEKRRLAIPRNLDRYDFLTGNIHFTKARALLDTLLRAEHGPSETQAVEMIAYLSVEVIRDRLIGDIVGAPEGKKGYGKHLCGSGETPLSKSRIDAALGLLTNLLQYATGTHRAAVLFCYSWLKLMTGDPETAQAYFKAAGDLNEWLSVPELIGKGLIEGRIPPVAAMRPVP